MNSTGKYEWPDLTKDTRSVEQAKAEMGWDALTPAQRIDRSRELTLLAQRIKDTL